MDERTEIKERLSITEVVSAYLPLKQAGRSLKAPCPFHQEKSASFMVNPERGIYHCFGCNEGGDIFSFVMKMEGLSFPEALEKLARQAGVELKAKRPEDTAASAKRVRLYTAHELAVRYFQASLVKNPKALEYIIKKRGLTRQTVKDFQIGYAPDSWNALTDFLASKGYTYSELLEAGLAGQKEGRQTVYDLFRGRIMFPITDRDGRPIGFTARVLDDSLPKYLNTPQTPLYDKSRAIFGQFLARDAIRANDEVVLVEGNMDVVASHQADVKQVVAASGTALTLDQLRTLSKLTKNIKLAFDTDRAGLAATERAIELGGQLGLTLRMVVIEGAKDADELISKDVSAWSAAIANAKYIVDYLFDRFATDYDLTSAIGKRQYTDRLAITLRRLGDPVEQNHYVRRLAEATDTSEEAIRAKMEQAQERPSSSRTPKTAVTSNAAGSLPATGAPVRLTKAHKNRNQREDELLAICLYEPLARIALEDLTSEHFSRPESQELYLMLSEHTHDNPDQIIGALGDPAYGSQCIFYAERMFGGYERRELPEKAFKSADRLQDVVEEVWREEINRELETAERDGDEAAWTRLMTRLNAMNQRKA
ncbi:DNA primase [Candidatus Saccharibacteria bacterium]|nr:DNA primase [Candidatus Saccharibacteria bacterium]